MPVSLSNTLFSINFKSIDNILPSLISFFATWDQPPGKDPKSPFEIIDIIESAGADISRVVICHIDRTYPNGEKVEELAKKGVYIVKGLYKGDIYNGIANFGERPTVQGKKLLLEVHLFNFSKNIYTSMF